MKNRIKPYREIKQPRFNEAYDKKAAQYLARADDDGFAVAKNNCGARSIDKNSDCWSGLRRLIKTSGSRFLRYFSKTTKTDGSGCR